MIKNYFITAMNIICIALICSCSNNKSGNYQNELSALNKAILERTDILQKSFRYEVFKGNKKIIDCDVLNKKASELINSGEITESSISEFNSFIKHSSKTLNIDSDAVPLVLLKTDDKNMLTHQILFSQLLLLDKMIFQTRNLENNFSNLNVEVRAEKNNEVKAGETYNANVFLSANDSSFNPQIEIYNKGKNGKMDTTLLEVVNGAGNYSRLTEQKGAYKFNGAVLMYTEKGTILRKPFNHTFYVK